MKRGEWVPVMLACNDDHGNLDRLHAVEIGGDGEIELSVSPMRGLAFRLKPAAFFISGARFDARHLRSHVGNIYWELFALEPREAVNLLNYTRNCADRFAIDSGDEVLFKWWESRIGDEAWLLREMQTIASRGIRL